jgi:hypothetical protein
VRKRHLAAAAAVTFSFTALSQAPAFAASAPAGTLLHQVITTEQAGWAEPAGSTGITQGAITALPNGSSQLVAVTSGSTLEYNVRNASGSWQGWDGIAQPGVTVENAGVAGMPNGSSQFVEVTSTGVLEHNILEADGSWQADGWGTPPLGGPFTPSGITQAAITALPNGSSEIVVASSNEAPAMGIRYSSGSWDTNWTQLYESPEYSAASDASIAGMPDGTTQVIEVAE